MKFRPCFLTCYHDNSYGHFHLFYDNRGELLWDKRFSTINSTWRSSFHPLRSSWKLGKKTGELSQTCTVIWGICQLGFLCCCCCSSCVLSLYFVGFHEKFRRNNKTKIEIVHEFGHKCVKINNTIHTLHRKKVKAMKKVPTHIPRTMYVHTWNSKLCVCISIELT